MIRGGGRQDAELRLPIEEGEDVLDECSGRQDVLEAFEGEALPDRARIDLGDLLVVDEADEVVVEDEFAGADEQGGDIAAAIDDRAHDDVIRQSFDRGAHGIRFLLGADGDDDVRVIGHRGGVVEHLVEELHVVDVHDERQAAPLRLERGRARRQHVGELEVLHEVGELAGPQKVLPDEARIEVGLIAQVLVQVERGVAHGLIEDVFVVVEEGAPFEDRAALLGDEPLGGEDDGVGGAADQIARVDVEVPGEPEVLEALREGLLVE